MNNAASGIMSESSSDEEIDVVPGRDAGCCVSDEVASVLSEVGSWTTRRSARNVVVPPASVGRSTRAVVDRVHRVTRRCNTRAAVSLAASDAKQVHNDLVEARCDQVVDCVQEAILWYLVQRAVDARTVATSKVPANPNKKGSHRGPGSKKKNLTRTKTHYRDPVCSKQQQTQLHNPSINP